MKASEMLELDESNRKKAEEEEGVEGPEEDRRVTIRDRVKAYLAKIEQNNTRFRLPLEINCHRDSPRGIAMDVRPRELRPIVEEVLSDFKDAKNELFVYCVRDIYSCKCHTFCSFHAGAVYIGVLPVGSGTKKKIKQGD